VGNTAEANHSAAEAQKQLPVRSRSCP